MLYFENCPRFDRLDLRLDHIGLRLGHLSHIGLRLRRQYILG